ncbi:hypothetical protein, partial [Vibrio sp. Vb1755]|uniref:hypothetical protein n=1 Tax=Vibrio sp. Vb1755 TaxID=3074645 RepID=UPI002964325E
HPRRQLFIDTAYEEVPTPTNHASTFTQTTLFVPSLLTNTARSTSKKFLLQADKLTSATHQ